MSSNGQQSSQPVKSSQGYNPFRCDKTRRVFFCIGEVMAVVGVLLVLGVGALVWRVQSAPVDLDFAQGYVQDYLKSSDILDRAEYGRAALHWPDLTGPLYLGLRDVTLYDTDGLEALDVREVLVALSKFDLLKGEIVPQGLVIQSPAMKVTRLSDGSLGIGFGDNQFDLTGGENGAGAEIEEDIHLNTSTLYSDLSSYFENTGVGAAFTEIEIRDAYVIYDDAIWGLALVIPYMDFSLSHQRDMPFLFDAALCFCDLPQDGELARGHGNALGLKAELHPDNAHVLATLNAFDPSVILQQKPYYAPYRQIDTKISGQFDLSLDAALHPVSASLALQSPASVFVNNEWFSVPIELDNFDLTADYDGAAQILTVSSLNGVFQKDVPFDIGGRVEFNKGQEREALQLQRADIQLGISDAAHDRFAELVPETLSGEPVYNWVRNKLSSGRIKGLALDFVYDFSALPAGADGESLSSDGIKKLDLSYGFENLDIAFKDGMSPVRGASGSARLDYLAGGMDFEILSGNLLELAITDARVKLENIIEAGTGSAHIEIPLSGPVSSLLAFIRENPINANHPFTAENNNVARGQFDGRVVLNMPTRSDLEFSDVDIAATGLVNNGYIADIYKGLELKSSQINLEIADGKISVYGDGALSGRPASMRYDSFMSSEGKPYKMQVMVESSLDQGLRDHLKIDLDDYIEGALPVKIVYSEYNARPSSLVFSGNLVPARFFIEPLSYNKIMGQDGRFSGSGVIVDGQMQRIEKLEISAPDFKLSGGGLKFSGDRVTGGMASVSAGFTQMDVEFERLNNGGYNIIANGARLDLRPFLSSGAGDAQDDGDVAARQKNAPPLVLSVKATVMQTGDKEGVGDAQIYAEIGRDGKFEQLEMDALAGKGQIYLRYKPDDETGQRTFRLEADDAGAFLRAFGVYDNIQGGKLIVYGEPINSIYQRNLSGLAEITDFKVVNAPYLARLLSGLSLSQATNSLRGQGIAFSKLEAGFDWFYRPQGSVLVLKEGRSSGNEMGLTFEGTYDSAQSTIDLEGTIIPLSSVNKAITSIPLIGDVLGGGSSSLFAATYSVEGSTDPAPEEEGITTSVNPLSVLAPGILRRILFE